MFDFPMTQLNATEINATETLADLRVDIDKIDEKMHALLIERGTIIDRVIAAKARQGGGSPFRPGREASMMRALVERHAGHLPLDTVESIWRIIISTFTFVQSPYSVHADASAGDAAMRDSVRFHFGFTVPYMPHPDAAGVIESVAAAASDLGMIGVENKSAGWAWWALLARAEAPKIIARLPFVERPGHPAGMPVFLLSKPLNEAAARDTVLYSVAIERWHDAIHMSLEAMGGEVLGNAATPSGLSLLICLPGTVGINRLTAELAKLPVGASEVTEVGSHAARYAIQPNS